MADTSRVQAKVQQMLVQNFNGVTLEKDGDFSLRNGSARSFVRVWSRENLDRVIVTVTVPLLFGVSPTPELFRHLAFHADDYIFGHLSAVEADNGTVTIMFTHALLGDFLDEPELTSAVVGLLGVADDLDDELMAQFGGERFHEQ